jgi:hypothetical protein
MRRSWILLSTVALLLTAAACTTDTANDPPDTSTPPVDAPSDEETPDVRVAPDEITDCSSAGARVTVRHDVALPEETDQTRNALIDAALTCDADALDVIIARSSQFAFTFGDETDWRAFWADEEARGNAPYLRLAQVLAAAPQRQDGTDLWVFPAVAAQPPDAIDPNALDDLVWLNADDKDRVITDVGYLSWRAAISADGAWSFFVSGD